MDSIPEILTSGSAYSAWHKCNRARWLGYEAPNDEGGRGWERKSLSLPLATGSWCHRVAQGLLSLAAGLDLSDWSKEMGLDPSQGVADASQVILAAKEGYHREALERGLDLGLQMDGSEDERLVQRTIAEQEALLEAFGWAYERVRVPAILREFEILSVELEEYALLSGDVGLQARCDAVLRRRSDQRTFVYNLKTSSNPNEKRWQDGWQVDQQLMTETLAVERRLGERIYGVIIDGFDKGPRVELDFQTLKERPKEGAQKWQGQRSRLIYGYKCEDIPGRPTLYDYEGTTRKGWGKFAVWEEDFEAQLSCNISVHSPVEYWIKWLPQEQVESAFVTLPPIMRSDRAVESVVRQIVATEQKIRERRLRADLSLNGLGGTETDLELLDKNWPQDFRSCVYPSRCAFFRLCHEDGASDPQAAGYQARQANHPLMESE